MVIRKEQMQALEQACARRFEDRMIERIHTYFPGIGKCVVEPQLRVMVRLATERAQTHMLTHERSVALYLDLMCLLGSSFDQDCQIPWAAAILADRSFPTQAERIDLLHSRAWEYAGKISADYQRPAGNREGSYLIRVLSEIEQESLEELPPQAGRPLAHEIVSRLRMLFPVKTGMIGDDCLRMLVETAFASAAGYGIRNARGLYLFSALSFVLGAGFDCDPLFPWASKTLSGETLTDPVTRTQQLYAAAQTALRSRWNIDLVSRD